MSELVEKLRKAADWGEDEFDVLSPQDAAAAADRIEALEAENFKLAAGACNVEGGLIGDDHGHVDCSLKARIEALERELAEAREALVAEREETLWSAYSSGLEKDGRWTHMFMSDGEWLVRKVGLDPRTGHYDAEYIKAAIPRAARAAIRNGERG